MGTMHLSNSLCCHVSANTNRYDHEQKAIGRNCLPFLRQYRCKLLFIFLPWFECQQPQHMIKSSLELVSLAVFLSTRLNKFSMKFVDRKKKTLQMITLENVDRTFDHRVFYLISILISILFLHSYLFYSHSFKSMDRKDEMHLDREGFT